MLGIWAATRHLVTRLGAVLLLAFHGTEIYLLCTGALPFEDRSPITHLSWAVLAGVLLSKQRERYHYRSALLSMAWFAMGAWLPAIVVLGTGWAEKASDRHIAAAAALSTTIYARAHGSLWMANQLGPLGLSVDATTLVGHAIVGGLEAAAWLVFLWAQKPVGRS